MNINKIAKYLQAGLDQNIQDVAKQHRLDLDTFSSFIKERFGNPPLTYIEEWGQRISDGTALVHGDSKTVKILKKYKLT